VESVSKQIRETSTRGWRKRSTSKKNRRPPFSAPPPQARSDRADENTDLRTEEELDSGIWVGGVLALWGVKLGGDGLRGNGGGGGGGGGSEGPEGGGGGLAGAGNVLQFPAAAASIDGRGRNWS
jgi:hypothetical protein